MARPSIVRVVIDHSASFAARKASMKIDGYFNPYFNAQNFPIVIGEGQEIVEMHLVASLTEEEEAVKNGWERAKTEDLMAYAANAWDEMTWVVARGSSGPDYGGNLTVPVLSGDDRKRYLHLINGDGRWRDGFRLLLVRKCD